MNKHSSGALRALLSYITARLGDALRESLVTVCFPIVAMFNRSNPALTYQIR